MSLQKFVVTAQKATILEEQDDGMPVIEALHPDEKKKMKKKVELQYTEPKEIQFCVEAPNEGAVNAFMTRLHNKYNEFISWETPYPVKNWPMDCLTSCMHCEEVFPISYARVNVAGFYEEGNINAYELEEG